MSFKKGCSLALEIAKNVNLITLHIYLGKIIKMSSLWKIQYIINDCFSVVCQLKRNSNILIIFTTLNKYFICYLMNNLWGCMYNC